MRVGQIRKRDANEPAIVKALEQAGALVMRLNGEGVPDLAVCRRGKVSLLEVKGAAGRATLAQERTLFEGWPVTTVRTIEDALRAIGAVWGGGR